jgi:hypothetical protein
MPGMWNGPGREDSPESAVRNKIIRYEAVKKFFGVDDFLNTGAYA